MYLKCPQGWTAVRTEKRGNTTLTVHHTQVQIYAGVCDSCDLCGIASCRFFDTSENATRLFVRAQAAEDSLEQLHQRLQPH